MNGCCGISEHLMLIKWKMDFAHALLLGLLAYGLPGCGALSSDLQVKVNADGSYGVYVRDKQVLASAPAIFTLGGTAYNTSGSLRLVNRSSAAGDDRLGPWGRDVLHYRAVGGGAAGAEVRLSFTSYDREDVTAKDCVLFGQHYVTGGPTVGPAGGDKDGLVSAFPSFLVGGGGGPQLGYLAYGGIMVGDTYKKIGRWSRSEFSMISGRNSGPLALFDTDGNALFISAFDNFMAASAVHDPARGTYSVGLMGDVRTVEAGTDHRTIVCYSNMGVNDVIAKWGKVMRTYYNKESSYREADITLNYLSYWSDNGAYYVNYYTKDGLIDQLTYEQAILAVNKDAEKNNIPYRSVQYSVWFEQGIGGGSKVWNASDKLFKDGMQYMYESTQWISTAHNRWWSCDTPYAQQNGGKYKWIIEKGRAYSLPIDPLFWQDMFRWSRQWGFRCYMQDWLNDQFDAMDATTTTLDVARTWLLQMGAGARENGLTVQYCMAQARHVLQSLEIPVVTQARASNDYNPAQPQWAIGISSMLSWAVGLAPFKDTFWTTSVQPGNYYNASEAHPSLQAAVSTLSMGPVGPGDKVGYTNTTLLMRCCAADGLILKPTQPAMAIDRQLLQTAFGGSLGPDGEVWTTFCDAGIYRYGVILAAGLKNTFVLSPGDTSFGYVFPVSLAYTTTGGHIKVFPFDAGNSLTIGPECGLVDYCLFYTSPIIQFKENQRLVLFGEISKFVPLSPKRFVQINVTDRFYIKAAGAPGELVSVYYAVYSSRQQLPRSEDVMVARLVVGADGTADVYIG